MIIILWSFRRSVSLSVLQTIRRCPIALKIVREQMSEVNRIKCEFENINHVLHMLKIIYTHILYCVKSSYFPFFMFSDRHLSYLWGDIDNKIALKKSAVAASRLRAAFSCRQSPMSPFSSDNLFTTSLPGPSIVFRLITSDLVVDPPQPASTLSPASCGPPTAVREIKPIRPQSLYLVILIVPKYHLLCTSLTPYSCFTASS